MRELTGHRVGIRGVTEDDWRDGLLMDLIASDLPRDLVAEHR